MLDVTRAYGLTFLFPEGDTAIGESLRNHGEFARPEVDLIGAHLDLFEEPGTFIDVGANIGSISLPLAATRSRWSVIAIEAHRGLSNVLAANALNNQLYNVEVMCAVAGATSGMTSFPSVPLSARMNFGALGSHLNDKVRPERVLMWSLDEIAPPNTRFIKMDVEGAEIEVLKGARKLIDEIRPIWLLEANRSDGNREHEERARETMRVLLNSAYKLFWFFAPFTTGNAKGTDDEIDPAAGGYELPRVAGNHRERLEPARDRRSERTVAAAARRVRLHDAIRVSGISVERVNFTRGRQH